MTQTNRLINGKKINIVMTKIMLRMMNNKSRMMKVSRDSRDSMQNEPIKNMNMKESQSQVLIDIYEL